MACPDPFAKSEPQACLRRDSAEACGAPKGECNQLVGPHHPPRAPVAGVLGERVALGFPVSVALGGGGRGANKG